MNEILLFALTGGLFLLGFIPYIMSMACPGILKNFFKIIGLSKIRVEKIEPQKISWFIWALVDTITLLEMMDESTVNGQIIGAAMGAWVVFGFTLFYGKRGWDWVDTAAVVLSFISIALWQIFNDPVLGIVMSQVAVFVGTLPTFKSALKDYTKEDPVAWTLFWFSCVFTVLTVKDYSISSALQPYSFFVIITIMMFLIFIRPRFFKTNN